jgi:hypothetical protein
VIFRMWDLNFGTWISHRGLHSGLRPRAPTSKKNLKAKLQAKENFDSTCLTTLGLVSRMRTSSSQMELMHHGGLVTQVTVMGPQ